jgi:hypothetical protein
MAKKDPIERALRRLQGTVRQPSTSEGLGLAGSWRVPEDIATSKIKSISLTRQEGALFREIQELLLADLRFEHLETEVEQAVRCFVSLAVTDRSTLQVPGFFEQHARQPRRHTLYIPVESLQVETEQGIGALRLVPLSAAEAGSDRLSLPLEPPIGCVAAVEVRGTHVGNMITRGRLAATKALRVLRVGLREHREINDRQLRFRLSHTHSFGSGLPGFRTQPDAAWNLPLADEDFTLVSEQPLARLSQPPANKLER